VAVGEEGQMGRRPIRGERAKPPWQEALGFRVDVIVRLRAGKDERVKAGRDARFCVKVEGAPKRSRRPRRARVPTRVNRSGATRGTAFWMGGSRRGTGRRPKRFS
jgi:hypothetical protein